MKKTGKRIVLGMMTVAAALFMACGDDKTNPTPDPTPDPDPDPDPEPTEQVVFTTVTEAIYRGDVKSNGNGLYTLLLETSDNKLYFELSSSLTDSATPVPDEGTYTFATDHAKGSFNGESYWMLSDNGTEINRRLVSGSFTLSATEKGYKLTGKVAGRDETELDFVYEGTMKFIDFNGEPAADAIKCLSGHGTYYGGYYIPHAADYYLVFFDTAHNASGDPYNYRICLDFTSARPTGGSLFPALGTYRIDKAGTFGEYTFVAGMMNGANGTLWQVPNNNGGATRYMVTDGFFTLRSAGNGKYQVFGTLKDNYGKEISFDYVGPLDFDNDAVGTFTSLTTDFDLGEAFYANQKCYETAEDGNYWKIYFYDEVGWTSKGKEGYFVAFDIPLPKDAKSIPAGEYTPAAHVLLPEAGNYIPGYLFAYDTSMAYAYGAWLAKGDGTASRPWAPIRGGSLKLTENADKTFTATFDVTDDNYIPKHIRGSFTGEIPLAAGSLEAPATAPILRRAARNGDTCR